MVDMNSTYGALFIGLLASAVLFGVTMLQAFVYFTQYPADKVWRKLAVCWLWFLDALHLALCAHLVYYYLVISYDDPSALLHIVWSFKARTVIDGLVVVSVHTLYTLRLWTLLRIDNHVKPFGKEDRRWSDQKLTRSAGASRWLMCRLVPWFVSALVVIGYGISIVMCYETFRLDSFDRLSHAPWATYVPFCFSTVIDTFIAGSLCYFLSRCRTESGAMNGPIRTLMVYTLNTGIISSVCSLIAISMMVAYPNTFISVAIEFLVIKLYINSYLAMVNARSGPRTGTAPHAAYTPNTSIALRDVVHIDVDIDIDIEHKPRSGPFLAYTARAGAHDDDCPRKSASPNAHDVDGDIVVSLSGRGSEPYRLRAPRASHADVCRELGVDGEEEEEEEEGEGDSEFGSGARAVDDEEAAHPPGDLPAAGVRPTIAPPAPLHILSSEPRALAASHALDRASPSIPGSASCCGSPSLPPSPSPSPSSPSPSSPSSQPQTPLPPLSPSRASPYPFQSPFSLSHSCPLPVSRTRDCPSPPERCLSPLRFASPECGEGGGGEGGVDEADALPLPPLPPLPVPPVALSSQAHARARAPILAPASALAPSQASAPSLAPVLNPLSAPPSAPSSGPLAAPAPAPSALPMVYAARDRYTRMVRSARTKGKARRALFDERGVALMWGLQGQGQAAAQGAAAVSGVGVV